MSHVDDRELDDPELRALFAPRRPDADAFRAAVAARLRARGEHGDAGGASGGGGTDSPAGPREALAGSGSGSGSGTRLERRRGGKDARTRDGGAGRAAERAAGFGPFVGDGGWSTLVSLPATLLVLGLVTFWRSDRSVAAALHAASPLPRGRREPRVHPRASGRAWFVAVVGTVALGYVGAAAPELVPDVVLGGFFLSMSVLAHRIGRVAAQQVAVGDRVGKLVADLLLAAVGAFWVAHVVADPLARGGFAASVPAWLVLVLGLLAVHLLRGAWARRPYLAGVALVGLLGVGGYAVRAAIVVPSDVPALATALDRAGSEPGEPIDWFALERAGDALRAAGESLPPMTALREAIARLVAEPVHAGGCHVWNVAAHLGLMTPEHWERVLRTEYARGHLPRLTVHPGAVPHGEHDAWLLPAMLATRDVDAARRDGLVARIEAAFPFTADPVQSQHLDIAVVCVRWLDALGRGDRVDALAPELRRLLARSGAAGVPGAPALANAPTSTGTAVVGMATRPAIVLLARAGAPPELDLRELAAVLRGDARRHRRTVLFAAELALLERTGRLPERSPFTRLVDERLLVGALLLVVLALRAAWRSRPLRVHAGGAMP